MVLMDKHTDTHTVFQFPKETGSIRLITWPGGGFMAGLNPEDSIAVDERALSSAWFHPVESYTYNAAHAGMWCTCKKGGASNNFGRAVIILCTEKIENYKNALYLSCPCGTQH